MMNQWAWPDDGWRRDECLVSVEGGEPFHIGQAYEKQVAQQLRCQCGGMEFHLARGDCYTAVRCTKCRMEVCVHEG